MNEQLGWPQLPPGPGQILLLPLYLLLLPILFLGKLMMSAPPSSSYTNEERWEINRGPDGRITGITIHRDARGG